MNIQIQAADTLFFRDGKPFAMGEETWANGMFPDIAPGVLLGALRAVYAAQKGLDKKDIAQETWNAAIIDYAICLRNVLTFPIPTDLVGHKKKRSTIGLIKSANIASSNPFNYLLCSPHTEKADELDNWRMDADQLSRYLNGEKSFEYDDNFLNINDFITSEPKIGIGRNRETNTSREGALYRVGMTRLEGKEKQNTASFWVNLENLDIEEGDFVRLGAENKIARFQKTAKTNRVNSPESWEQPQFFKLYLSTPAIFKKGIIPDWIDEQTDMKGTIPGTNIKVRLETCAVGRFLSFGGFDLQAYAPKTMMKAVPAGSVYYFQLEDETNAPHEIEKVIEHFSKKRNPISEIRANEGLGKVFVGKQ